MAIKNLCLFHFSVNIVQVTATASLSKTAYERGHGGGVELLAALQQPEELPADGVNAVEDGQLVGYCTVLYCTVLYCTVLYCTCRGWAPPRGGAALAAPAPPPPGLWCSARPSCSLAHGRLIAMGFNAISFYIYLCLVGTFNKEKALVVVVGAISGPCGRHLSFL